MCGVADAQPSALAAAAAVRVPMLFTGAVSSETVPLVEWSLRARCMRHGARGSPSTRSSPLNKLKFGSSD
jgi:hypothetical protein